MTPIATKGLAAGEAVPDKTGEKEELAQIIRRVLADYRKMGEDALARVAAGRIQSAGYRKGTAP